MKRYIVLLAIAVSSCATHSTAPKVPARSDTSKHPLPSDTSHHPLPLDTPSHPFPAAFKEVDVTYQNLPGNWEDESSSWDYTVMPPVINNSSSGGWGLNGTFTYAFEVSSFHHNGDTITTNSGLNGDPSFWAVVDTNADSLLLLEVGQYNSNGPGPNGSGLDCQHVGYEPDSNGNYVVRLFGSSLQAGLTHLGSSTYTQSGFRNQGSRIVEPDL